MTATITIPFTPSMSGWGADAEMAELVRWFTAAELPLVPFDLVPAGTHPMCCVRVLDPVAYFAALRRDVERGPLAAGAAGLRANLRQLRTLFGQPVRPHVSAR